MFDLVKSTEISQVFPYVKDKMVIDLVNGISVAKSQNQYAKQRNSKLLSRMLDNFSGKAALRQEEMNDNLIAGIETAHALIMELSQDITQHGVALLQVKDNINELQNNVGRLADGIMDIHSILQQHKNELNDLDQRLRNLQDDHYAVMQLEMLMTKWKAGGFHELSPMARAYTVLDTLHYGEFGQYLRYGQLDRISKYTDLLKDHLIIQLKEDLQVKEKNQGAILKDWLWLPENINQDLQDVLAYQGDWCWQNVEKNKNTFTATQWQALPSAEQTQYQHIPFAICSPELVGQRLVNERFSSLKKGVGQ